MMYSLDQIGLIPAIVSDVKSRKDVNPFYNGKLPIFVSPMTCILNKENIKTFMKSKVIPILPVTKDKLSSRQRLDDITLWIGWTAVTLQEFKEKYVDGEEDPVTAYFSPEYKILIDVANGNMSDLFEMVKKAKSKFGSRLKVMAGNIANPLTYVKYCEAGIDYVRIGVGGGSGCTTSVQTGMHTSIPWMLEKITDIKKNGVPLKCENTGVKTRVPFEQYLYLKGGIKTKIVADGGINSIDKAIKALALGADYVMMGRCFAECEEALGKTFLGVFQGTTIPYRLYYGQSSEQGQIDRFGKVKSNPEGIARQVPVITNLNEFSNKFEAALRSAMSYANAHTLDEFIGKVKWEVMSLAEFKAFDK